MKDLLFEIGVEELPHGFIPGAISQLVEKTKVLLNGEHLASSEIRSFSTPRRLAILITGLPESQTDREIFKKGPLLKAAFQNGALAPAGKGFLKSFGIETLAEKDLVDADTVPAKKDGAYFKTENGQTFLYGFQFVRGKKTVAILAEKLPELIASLEFPKSMRWAEFEFPFARPIRWILALFGSEVVPFTIAGIHSGNATYGHPQFFHRNEKVSLAKPADYAEALRKKNVLADSDERRDSILKQIAAIEKKNGVKLLETEKVVPLVRDLTEWPHLVLASFDESFLRLPREVLISEMVEHQKYFPVEDASGKLKSQFVITANIEKEEHVIRGNLKVLTSRLRDGAFLYEEDLKTSLKAMGEKLRTVTYMKELGTVSEKVERTVLHARALSDSLKLSKPDEVETLCRLMKSDLVSKMVYEFPALQGVIGEYYAISQAKQLGIDPKLAVAIREHYMPLGAGAALPETPAGIALSLAEKIDTLLGHFAIGNIPTGSADPFALRRQALGVIRIAVEKKLSFQLHAHLFSTSKAYEEFRTNFKAFSDEGQLIKAVLDFVHGRFKAYLKDLGYAPDEIDALPEAHLASDFFDLVTRLETLKEFRSKPDFIKYVQIRKRVSNILEKSPTGEKDSLHPVKRESLTEEAEKSLFDHYQKTRDALQKADHKKQIELALTFHSPLETFFEKVLVEDKDEAKRLNRKNLLALIDRDLGGFLRVDRLKA